MENRVLDQVVRFLQGKFRSCTQEEVEDAISTSVERLLKRGAGAGLIEDVMAWITTVASNELRRGLRHPKPAELTEADPDRGPSPLDAAVLSDLLSRIDRIVASWENAHLRTITSLYIEAYVNDWPLSLVEAKSAAEAILGEELSIGSIGAWKRRGFVRLAQELVSLGYVPEWKEEVPS
jgi:hypothetical protein